MRRFSVKKQVRLNSIQSIPLSIVSMTLTHLGNARIVSEGGEKQSVCT